MQFRASLEKLRWGITGQPTESTRPIKKHALLDRRLAAELIVSFPPGRVDGGRVSLYSQYTVLGALPI